MVHVGWNSTKKASFTAVQRTSNFGHHHWTLVGRLCTTYFLSGMALYIDMCCVHPHG